MEGQSVGAFLKYSIIFHLIKSFDSRIASPYGLHVIFPL